MPDVVFERRVGAARLVGLWLLALAWPATLWALFRTSASLVVALTPAIEVFGKSAVIGSLAALALAPAVAFAVVTGLISRRFGRCVAGSDWLVLERALLPTWAGRTIALRSDVRDRVLRPGLVHLFLDGDGVRQQSPPFVVPTSTQAELESALLELDRTGPEPLAAGRRSGRRETLLLTALVLFVIAGAAATALVLERRLGEHWALPALLTLIILAFPLMLCLSAALTPGARRVLIGQSAVAVGEELFAWDELTWVGLSEGFLECAAGSRTCLAFVGADEARLREAISARLAEAGRPVEELLGPLPASVAGWRRRAGRLLQAAPALLVPVGTLIAACVAPNFVCIRREGTEGQRLYVLYARDGEAPATIVLDMRDEPQPLALRTSGWWSQTLSTDGATRTLELPADATFIHLSPQGTVTSAQAWKETEAFRLLRPTLVEVADVLEVLEELGEGLEDASVRSAAFGWSTPRDFQVTDGYMRLLWRVDRGSVTWAITVDGSSAYAPAALPTSHAELLEVRRRVLAGERLADVLTR